MNDPKCLHWQTVPVAHVGIKKRLGGLANHEKTGCEIGEQGAPENKTDKMGWMEGGTGSEEVRGGGGIGGVGVVLSLIAVVLRLVGKLATELRMMALGLQP